MQAFTVSKPSSTSLFIMISFVTPLIMIAYFNATKSIQPQRRSRPGYSSIFMTDLTDLAACFIKQLCRERAATDTCAISLEDSINFTDVTRRNPQTGTATSTNRIGRSHERIRTKVNIQHSALCTFGQNRLAFFQIVINHMFAVDQRNVSNNPKP